MISFGQEIYSESKEAYSYFFGYTVVTSPLVLYSGHFTEWLEWGQVLPEEIVLSFQPSLSWIFISAVMGVGGILCFSTNLYLLRHQIFVKNLQWKKTKTYQLVNQWVSLPENVIWSIPCLRSWNIFELHATICLVHHHVNFLDGQSVLHKSSSDFPHPLAPSPTTWQKYVVCLCLNDSERHLCTYNMFLLRVLYYLASLYVYHWFVFSMGNFLTCLTLDCSSQTL